MSDWPTIRAGRLVTIHPWTLESIGVYIATQGGTSFTGVASAAYPEANLAIFVPFVVIEPLVVVKLLAYNGATVSGNIDLGIYAEDGTKLVSSGSTAQAGTAVVQPFDVTDTRLGPGVFYLTVALDNTTGTLRRGLSGLSAAMGCAIAGLAQQATAFPLPATATLATCAYDYIPDIALTARTLV